VAVRKLAEKIRKSYLELRSLFRGYDENIEVVDPQLKNNPELVNALHEFEKSWEKGKRYFCSPSKCKKLLHFSQLLEGTAEKYKEFTE
jgi:hypothetical protein